MSDILNQPPELVGAPDDSVTADVAFVMPKIPGALHESDWMFMIETIGLERALSKAMSSTFKDAEWLEKWNPHKGMKRGWFESPKGIFIVIHPFVTAINRKLVESLCGTQDNFSRIVPPLMYLLWRTTANVLRQEPPNAPSRYGITFTGTTDIAPNEKGQS